MDLIPQTTHGNETREIQMLKLSAREQDVLRLWLKEGRLKPVAESLGLSLNTVRKQRESLMRKLGARNSTELVILAVRKGLVEVEP